MYSKNIKAFWKMAPEEMILEFCEIEDLEFDMEGVYSISMNSRKGYSENIYIGRTNRAIGIRIIEHMMEAVDYFTNYKDKKFSNGNKIMAIYDCLNSNGKLKVRMISADPEQEYDIIKRYKIKSDKIDTLTLLNIKLGD